MSVIHRHKKGYQLPGSEEPTHSTNLNSDSFTESTEENRSSNHYQDITSLSLYPYFIVNCFVVSRRIIMNRHEQLLCLVGTAIQV